MIKPIETVYNGYRFRSRLEARWAVFFDALGIQYQYEPEGWDLKGVWYLPDFYFPEWDKYAEIKPFVKPTDEEFDKVFRLCQYREKSVLLIFGHPWPGEYRILPVVPCFDRDGDDKVVTSVDTNSYCGFGFGTNKNSYMFQIAEDWSGDYSEVSLLPLSWTWSTKRENGELSCVYAFEDKSSERFASTLNEGVYVAIGRYERVDPDYLLGAAYLAARQARFEHGETPQVPE